ncbi:MAG: D-glycerate dehydrogenase [Phycisphaerae bacterium]|nr:D-glycerate dehydrogenase [Phycisphaerae bacterium]
MSTPQVVITHLISPAAETMLREAGLAVVARHDESPPPRSEVLQMIAGANAVLTVLSVKVDDEFLAAAGPGLRIVANYAVGFDNIDVAACGRRGVRASNTPGVLTEATADIAWSLILSTARRVIEGDRIVRTGQWQGWKPTELLGLELSGATLGVIGAGRIGCATARRSSGFNMRVVYSHPRAVPELDGPLAARRVELDELLRTSDIVSLHVPFRPENRHMLDARRLALLRDGALLINTARGSLIDEAALVRELSTGRIRAGLDVYEFEPRLSPGLAELPNVVLLPHLGSATHATRRAMARLAAENILAVLSGREPVTPIA